MGLLYLFPVDESETTQIDSSPEGAKKVVLKTYGLPSIFWFYFFSILVLFIFLYLAVSRPLKNLLLSGETFDYFLVYGTYFLLFSIPIASLSLFFYQKQMIIEKSRLTILHTVFAIPFYKKSWDWPKRFFIQHFLDSPNMARINQTPGLEAHQNRGYHELFLETVDNKNILLDRSSQKRDLERFIDFIHRQHDKL